MIPDLPPFELGFPHTDLRRRLVAAVLSGEKTSTTGLLSDFERDGEPLPRVGDRFRLVDDLDQTVGIVETTGVRVTTIDQVALAFAVAEGEGFTTVTEWRAAHEAFWLSYAEETREWLGDPTWVPSGETEIVCEWFRLIERPEPTDSRK